MIRIGERLMTWDDATQVHLRARAFIEGELYPRTANERRRTIACTQYWPSFKAANRDNPNESKWAPVYASDMDAFILEHGPRFWIAGHLHTSKDFLIGDTRLISNPRAGEAVNGLNPDFLETAILEFAV